MANKNLLSLMLLVSVAGLLNACRQDMHDQPKYLAYRGSESFPDSLSSRSLVEGTVPRGYLREDVEYYTGKTANGKATTDSSSKKDTTGGSKAASSDVQTFPFPITKEILDLGGERYNVYCSPCHGMLGDGRGMIALRGFKMPPSYHSDRLRTAAVGHFFDVITHGFGVMPDYAMQIPPQERWAITAYIRALQLSQNATLADVPAEDKVLLK